MDNRVLIILGMHRSCTSLTANWLQQCGLNIGEKLVPALFSNKDGHFEDIDFRDLHEAIFRNHGIPYAGFENIEEFKPTNSDVDMMSALVRSKNRKYEQWGWKEPRTCLFINEYIKLIPSAKILVIVRDYNSVINSLINRDIHAEKIMLKNTGRLGFLRAFMFTMTKGQQLKRKLGIKYTAATIIYYKRIIEVLVKSEGNRILVANVASLANSDNAVLCQLQKWGFSIRTDVHFKDVINPKYLTASANCQYISERNELRKLQREIDSYSIGLSHEEHAQE